MRRLVLLLAILTALPIGILAPATAATGAAGSSQVHGDFDGDGFDDLAIGAPGDENDSGADGAGVVNVLYGRANGVTAAGDQLWHQGVPGIADDPESCVSCDPGTQPDHFGGALAAGDFDGDGRDDLAIGVPHEDVAAPDDDAGAVNVLYGTSQGLKAAGDQFFHQDNLPGGPQDSDEFGFSLVAADFNRDGRDDLAIGVPGDTVNADDESGAVHVLYGARGGLTRRGNQYWHQDRAGIAGAEDADPGDSFGTSLTAANFGRGRGADLAIGVPGEEVAGEPGAGAVDVLYGGSRLSATGDQFWNRESPGIEEDPGSTEQFGFALAAGNFGRSGEADLAVGVPGDDPSGHARAGGVQVIYGTPRGLKSRGDQYWHQDRPDVPGDAGDFEQFGFALAAGNFGKSRHSDLAVGTPADDLGGVDDAGTVGVLYGRRRGLTGSGAQLWHQDRLAGESAETGDEFGVQLAAGDYGGGPRDDLAVGVPSEDDAEGAVHVIYGRRGGLRVRGNQMWHQDVAGILGASDQGDFFGFFGPCHSLTP